MKRKRYFRILTIFLCLSVLIGTFAACNTAPEPSETSGDAGTSEEVTTEEVTTEKIPTETVSSRLTPPEGYTLLKKIKSDSPYLVQEEFKECECIHLASHEDEYTYESYPPKSYMHEYSDQNLVGTTKEGDFFGVSYTGEYTTSFRYTSERVMDVYSIKDDLGKKIGGFYVEPTTGAYTRFWIERELLSADTKVQKTQAECFEIAKTFFAQNVEKADAYIASDVSKQNADYYSFQFVQSVNGILAKNSKTIYMTKYGDIYKYNFVLQTLEEISVSEEEFLLIEEAIHERLYQAYSAKAFEEYALAYKLPEPKISVTSDGQYVLYYSIELWVEQVDENALDPRPAEHFELYVFLRSDE